MARIELKGVAHSYAPWPQKPADYAVHRVDLRWEDGMVHGLLGPKGCGKTTLLEAVSGLIEPSSGRVEIDGDDVTGLPPERRNIAHVFREPAVYGALTVFDNLAVPLRTGPIGDAERRRRIEDVADLLGLGDDLGQRARTLDRDTRRMISLGRALVREDAAAILLDDPLKGASGGLGRQLRRDLKQWCQRTGQTLIYATEDAGEALAFADRVTVMRHGEVLESGTPQDLIERPRNRFVGETIGDPAMNLMPCRIEDGRAVVERLRIPLDPAIASRAAQTGKALELGIRPEFLRFSAAMVSAAVQVNIIGVEDRGAFNLVTARVGKLRLYIKIPGHELVPGRQGWLVFPPERTLIFAAGKTVA